MDNSASCPPHGHPPFSSENSLSGGRRWSGGRERTGSRSQGAAAAAPGASRLRSRRRVGRSLSGPAGRARKPAGAAFVGLGYPPPTPSRQKPLGADFGGSRSIGCARTPRAESLSPGRRRRAPAAPVAERGGGCRLRGRGPRIAQRSRGRVHTDPHRRRSDPETPRACRLGGVSTFWWPPPPSSVQPVRRRRWLPKTVAHTWAV